MLYGLPDLQANVRAALLDGDERAAVAAVRDDAPSAAARLAIYRHHVSSSLTRALESTFPVVMRLVDPRFFRYAVDRYMRCHPPASPCLFEYGATFADFLAGFEPASHLAYLPDVARLEWAMNSALHAPDVAPLDPRALDVATRVGLHPSVTVLASRWPIDAIWRANQPGGEDVAVDLAAGGVHLQVWRAGDDVVFRPLSGIAFAFRAGLARSGMLDVAAEAALALDAGVDLSALVRDVLEEHVLVPVAASTPTLNASWARSARRTSASLRSTAAGRCGFAGAGDVADRGGIPPRTLPSRGLEVDCRDTLCDAASVDEPAVANVSSMRRHLATSATATASRSS